MGRPLIKNIIQHYPGELKTEIIKISNAFDDVSTRDTTRSLGFCEPNIISIIQELSTHYEEVEVKIDGGYDGAEKCKVLLFPKYFGDVDSGVKIFEIKYSYKFVKLEHRQILGTILNNGIDYSKFGDIIISPDGRIKIIVDEILFDTLPYLIERVANQKVSFVESKNVEIEKIENIEKSVRVKSLRIDIFVKQMARKSRSKANDILDGKNVKINFVTMENKTKNIAVDDVISIRGYGRFIIVSITPTSKGSFHIIYK